MTKITKDTRLKGLIPAPFMPVFPDCSLATERIPVQTEYFKKQGINCVFVSGASGEFTSFTPDERIAILKKWIDTGKDDFIILFHAGDNCRTTAEFLAKKAEELGADGISVMSPFFFKPPSVKSLADWCAAVAAQAPKTPFYYYHVPRINNVDLPMIQFLREAEGLIPNLQGIKFSSTDLTDCVLCTTYKNYKYEMLFGWDESLLSGLALGCCGAIGSTYNYAAHIFRKVWDAFYANDLRTARAYQAKGVELVDVLLKYGVIPTSKAIMAMAGVELGPPRPPFSPLTPEQFEDVRSMLISAGLFQEHELQKITCHG